MQEETQKFTVDLYIRVSTDRQAKEGDSLEEQESELKKFCDYRGFKIHKLYIEKGKSAKNTNRPEYQNLVKDVKANKIQAVVVKKIDRLSRSLLDFEDFMKLLQEKNIEFISIKENFDTTTALGKAMLRVALVFAQLEREQTSERLIDVFNYRASQGLYNGGIRPFGYTSANKELVPYKKEKEIVELIFKKFIETESTTLTAKFLNDSGLRNRNNKLWDKRQIQKIIQNPSYTGQVKWRDQLFAGIHQPIITMHQFEKANVLFNKTTLLNQRSNLKSLLKKLLICGYCLSPMTPSHSLNKKRQKYYYYRCTSTYHAEKEKSPCQFKYVSFKDADQNLMKILLRLSEEYTLKPIENQILVYNQQIETEKQTIQSQIVTLETAFEEIKQKKDKFLDSLISHSFSNQERKRINEKLTELELEEKQIKASIYKTQFELTLKDESKIDLTQFKKEIIKFKTDQDQLTQDQLLDKIQHLIKSITYYPNKLAIQFKLLPWPTEFPTEKNQT